MSVCRTLGDIIYHILHNGRTDLESSQFHIEKVINRNFIQPDHFYYNFLLYVFGVIYGGYLYVDKKSVFIRLYDAKFKKLECEHEFTR